MASSGLGKARARRAWLAVALSVSLTAAASAAAQLPREAATLAPTGTWRVAFLATNPVHGRVQADGHVTGPVADLVGELARRHRLPFRLIAAPDAAAVIDAIRRGDADAGVLAYEAARARDVLFAGAFAIMRSTYLVRSSSPLRTVADADRAGVRIGAVRGLTQGIFLGTALAHARLQLFDAQPPAADLRRLLAEGHLEAFGLNTQRAEDAVAAANGQLRALDGSYVDVEQSFVVRLDNAAAANLLRRFARDAVLSGFVRAALDRAKLSPAAVETARTQ